MGDLFFVLSKLVWALLRPDTLLLLLTVAGLILMARRPRAGRICVALAVGLYALIGILPLQTLLLAPLENRFPDRPETARIEGIVQLGGAEAVSAARLSGQPEVGDAADRYLATLALARAHPEATVIFAGGGAALHPRGGEARIARTLLTEAGLPRGRLILENRSRNTAENAANARRLAPQTLTGEWLLVTSAFHMPRAVGTFCAAGWSRLVPWPVDHRVVPFRAGWNPAGNLDELGVALREWIGLAAYRATGRSDSLFPSGCP